MDGSSSTDKQLDSNSTQSRSDEGSNEGTSSIVTSHRENLNHIQSDTFGGWRSRHTVPEHTPVTLRKWSVSTPRSLRSRRSTLTTTSEAGSEFVEVPYDDDKATGGELWAQSVKTACCGGEAGRSSKEWLHALLPMTRWLSTYRWKEFLQTDILAGLTVGVMIIPQSMSYAKLAGLPVEFGLYSSLMPIYAYAFFGSSRQLAVGPVAMVSLLLSTGLTIVLENEGITPDNNPDYQEIYNLLALQTSVLVGICYIVMGLLRLGFVTIFLSHAVVSGFTSAAAIIIGLSQLKYIFGYNIPNDKSLHGMLYNIFSSINEFNWKTFVLGSSCTFALIGFKRIAAKWPRFKWLRAAGPLFVTVLCIVLQATIDLEAKGIPIVNHIPAGLPNFTGGLVFPVENLGNLGIVILSIVIVGFMESIAIAKKLSQVHGYELDSSMELIGLGMANLSSGLFGGYPVTGSFSRSAVNNASGAMSGISAMVTATMVVVTLLCLTSVFEMLALCALAAIVISGVVSLVDYSEAMYLWRVHRFDFAVWIAAFIGTLFLGVEAGLGMSVGISLLLVIFESAYPHTAVLGRLPGTHHYRNIKQYPDAEQYDGIVLIRVDAPIYFANSQHVRDKIAKYYQRAEEKLIGEQSKSGDEESRDSDPLKLESQTDEILEVRFVILELNPVSHIDTSALHMLQDMHSMLKDEKGIQLCLSNPNPRVMMKLVKSGFVDELGRDHIFVSLHDAVHYCLDHMDAKEMERHESRLLMKVAEDEPLPMSASTGAIATMSDVPQTIEEADSNMELGLNVD